jgi:hypothetical protein
VGDQLTFWQKFVGIANIGEVLSVADISLKVMSRLSRLFSGKLLKVGAYTGQLMV